MVQEWLDTSAAPLLVQLLPEVYSYEELDAGFTAIETYCERLAARSPNARIALISDASRPSSSTARNRARIGESLKKMSPILSEIGVAQAFVMRSTVMRHALMAIFWIKRPPWSVKVFTRHEDALLWLKAQFAEEGVTMPELVPWWNNDAPVKEAG